MYSFGGEVSGLYVLQAETCVVEPHLIRVKSAPIRRQDADRLSYSISDAPELSLVLAQLLLRLLSVLDIGARSVPSDHFSPLVADRHSTKQEPTVFSVEATDTSFLLARFFRSDDSQPSLRCPSEIFG